MRLSNLQNTHVSKSINGGKQKCTKLWTPFYALFFTGRIRFVWSVIALEMEVYYWLLKKIANEEVVSRDNSQNKTEHAM